MADLRVVGRIAGKPNSCEVMNNGRENIWLSIAEKRNFKNKDGEYETDFFMISFFANTAKYVENYCNVGDLVDISCELQTKQSTNSLGQIETKYFINGRSIRKLINASTEKKEYKEPSWNETKYNISKEENAQINDYIYNDNSNDNLSPQDFLSKEDKQKLDEINAEIEQMEQSKLINEDDLPF